MQRNQRPRLSMVVRRPRRGGRGIRRQGQRRGEKEERTGRKGRRGRKEQARRVSGRTRGRSRRIWARFDESQEGYQREEVYEGRRPRGGKRTRGRDGIARCFVRLTARRTPRSRRASREGIKKKEAEYYGAFVRREGRVRRVFVVTDVRWFYIGFEGVMIPMYRRIGVWGSRERKVRAGYMFFRYTMGGSVRMLVGVRYMRQRYGTTDMERLKRRRKNVEVETGRRRWLAFFRAMAVKVPMVPVHVWLPEAHVEAPTGGSVILAGILLKRGTYGMRRMLRGRRTEASIYFTPRVYAMAVVGIVYPARSARRQTDRKRIVAYASVSHMNMTLVGRFSMTVPGVEGAVRQMVSHGLVAGGRFMGIGVRYDRYHTRRVNYYGGVAQTMPRYVRVRRRLTRGNIALPGTSGFVGEWRILIGIVKTNRRVTRRSRRGMVLGAAYSLWRYNRVAYGNLKRRYRGVGTEEMKDRDRREVRMFVPVIVGMIRLGIKPNRVLDVIHVSCVSRVENRRS